MKELEDWQERFSVLLQRKVSLGEAIGILVRMSSARYSRISDASEMTLSQLVERMIGYEE
jgi:hypothetical protein